MRTSVLLLALAAWVPSAATAEGTLELTRVVLSTGGVGYFEHRATVEGNATLTLELDRDRVDDVLKSIVVFDDAGRVGAASLPGEEPLAQIFRNLPFGPEALESPVALLRSLQGARVRVAGQRSIEGRLLQVEAEVVALPDGAGTTVRHRLSLMTEAGLAQAVVEESETITLLEPKLRAQVEEALAAIAEHRVRDRRTITLAIAGEGRRAVTVGYVIAAPLWKASYRATLPKPGEDRGRLLGWAHLENLSGEDWRDVDLTLVSGDPVTFRQAIYRAYLVDRPEVPVEVLGRILPRLDEGAVALAPRAAGAAALDEELGTLAKQGAAASMMAVGEMAAAPMAADAAAPAPELFDAGMARAGTEAATQVVFRVPDPVTLERGRTLMVPIVAQPVPMARIAVYQPATHPRHPVAGVRLTNDSAAGLPPGVMTLYEAGGDGRIDFVGDARLATLPPGDARLVGYALDQKTLIDAEPGYAQSIGKAKIHDGVLELEIVDRQTTTYRVETLAGEARSIVIEQPRQPGWTLVRSAEAEVEATATDYRIPVEAGAGSTTTVEVVLEQTRWQEIALVDLDLDTLASYVQTGEIDADVRGALAGLLDLRRRIEVANRRIEALDLARQRVFEDQGRIRENLYEVPQGSDLERQYLARLADQESVLLANDAERAHVADELAGLERELADRIAALDL
jgi:hypothetical protein